MSTAIGSVRIQSILFNTYDIFEWPPFNKPKADRYTPKLAGAIIFSCIPRGTDNKKQA